MLGWYVYDRYGVLYCGAETEIEAKAIAERIRGNVRYISVMGTYNRLEEWDEKGEILY